MSKPTDSATVPPMPQAPSPDKGALVPLTPALVHTPDGGQVWAIDSMQVSAAGQRAMTRAAATAHAAGLTPKQAAKQAAGLYRAMLAEALVECGIDSPVLRRACGRDK